MAGNVQEAADHIITTARSLRDRYDTRIAAFERGMSPFQRQLFAVFRFLAVFALLSLPFYAVLNSGWDAGFLRSLHATVSAELLSFTGLEATGSGPFIQGEQFIIDVTRDSTGWKSLLALTALIVASGRSFRRTVHGILFGAAVVFVANILRITSMFYAVAVFNVEYELLHTLLWRWGLTAVVLGTWLTWLYADKMPLYGRLSLIDRVFRGRF